MYPLDDSSLDGMTEEEINERIVARTNEMNKHLDYLLMDQTYGSVDSVSVSSTVLSQMLTNLNSGKLARKAIDTQAHSKIINITEVRTVAWLGSVIKESEYLLIRVLWLSQKKSRMGEFGLLSP